MDWLTRDQIDQVIDSLSAADLIEGTANGRKDAQVAGAAFDSAALRLELSNGTPATEHVRAADFSYLAERIGEAINVDSPKSETDSTPPASDRQWQLTPEQVRRLQAPDYIAMLRVLDEERREHERAAKKRGRRR